MRTGGALTAFVIRSVIFCFVVAAFAPSPRHAADHLASFLRAGLGFIASVVVTVTLLIALGAAISPPPAVASLGLRGTF